MTTHPPEQSTDRDRRRAAYLATGLALKNSLLAVSRAADPHPVLTRLRWADYLLAAGDAVMRGDTGVSPAMIGPEVTR